MEQITVKTVVNGTLDKVWEKWTNPMDVMQWNNPSDDWHCPSAENDLRVGGKFTFVMAAKDGSMSFPFGGVYTKVELNHCIEYELGDGRKVSVVFELVDGVVHVTESFDPENVNSLELQRGGWQAILDNFKKHAEQ